MLTDVFAIRYENTPLWTSFDDRHRRFMVQSSKIITEQLFPEFVDGKAHPEPLEMVHSKLSMEIGIDPLSPLYAPLTGRRIGITERTVSFFTRPLREEDSIDVYIKRRVSFVELALREKASLVDNANRGLSTGATPDQDFGENTLLRSLQQMQKKIDQAKIIANSEINHRLKQDVDEFNERFRQARLPLEYNNGFVHIRSDELVAKQIESPFWNLVADTKWKNVEHDMHEAVDRHDTKGRDPAFYAAKSLESAIKIISSDKGWTRGNEKGAGAFIDNLVSQNNGRFIEPWEADALKAFFSKVRNPLGHGPGGETMSTLTPQQDSWAIETCMSWTKSLITRM